MKKLNYAGVAFILKPAFLTKLGIHYFFPFFPCFYLFLCVMISIKDINNFNRQGNGRNFRHYRPGGIKMNYTINSDEIRLFQIKQVISEVETLQKLLSDEGYDYTFDQVLRLYSFNEINKKLEDIIPVE